MGHNLLPPAIVSFAPALPGGISLTTGEPGNEGKTDAKAGNAYVRAGIREEWGQLERGRVRGLASGLPAGLPMVHVALVTRTVLVS